MVGSRLGIETSRFEEILAIINPDRNVGSEPFKGLRRYCARQSLELTDPDVVAENADHPSDAQPPAPQWRKMSRQFNALNHCPPLDRSLAEILVQSAAPQDT